MSGSVPFTVDDHWFFQSSDGTEAWVLFKPGAVSVVTDIHDEGQPHNAVTFEPQDLRMIADEIERRALAKE
jgi:hypothetical protein